MRKMNIAIIGLGNIGSYLYKYLNQNKKIISKKNNCIPKQIPSIGLFKTAASFRASVQLVVSKFNIAWPNEPTPGKIIWLAFFISL